MQTVDWSEGDFKAEKQTKSELCNDLSESQYWGNQSAGQTRWNKMGMKEISVCPCGVKLYFP